LNAIERLNWFGASGAIGTWSYWGFETIIWAMKVPESMLQTDNEDGKNILRSMIWI
jgi:hypothetical protein